MAASSTHPPSKRTAATLAALGLALLALAVWGLRTDMVWVSQAFYAYAWWAWILLLDAFCVWRRGSSLLTTRRHLLGLLATSSVTFWFLFEALNLRFENWYYIGTFQLGGPLTYLGAGSFVVAAFSTVFIGMFEAFDALGAAGILTRRGQPRRLPTWLPTGLQVLGLVMAGLAVAFPFYLAPLVWGSLTFLLDPWNYKRGNRSLLRDFEAGDGRAVARLFLAGLISGLVWESLNFAAPQKWVYTVRGLEGLKLFEMPLLGFLGFPALAFDAVTAFSLLSYYLCGNLGWEHADDLAAPARAHPGGAGDAGESGQAGLTGDATRALVGAGVLRRYWRTVPLQAVFWVVVTAAMMPRTIGSIRLRLEHLPALASAPAGTAGPSTLQVLEAEDIRWPRQLLRALAEESRADELAGRLGWDVAEREAVTRQTELYLFKGIGAVHGRFLGDVGVHAVADLAAWEPEQLHRELVRVAADRGFAGPHLDWVRVWVLASRSRGVLMRG